MPWLGAVMWFVVSLLRVAKSRSLPSICSDDKLGSPRFRSWNKALPSIAARFSFWVFLSGILSPLLKGDECYGGDSCSLVSLLQREMHW